MADLPAHHQKAGRAPHQTRPISRHDNPLRGMHERAFPRAAAMYRYAGWAAGRVCGRGARLAEWPGRLSTGNGRAIAGSGLGRGRFAAWRVIAQSVRTLAGKAGTASGRVAGQSVCLSRKRCGSVMTAQAFSGQCRTRQHLLHAHAGIPVAGDRGTAPLSARGLSWVTRPGMRPWDATTGSRFSSRRADRCDVPRTSGGTRSC